MPPPKKPRLKKVKGARRAGARARAASAQVVGSDSSSSDAEVEQVTAKAAKTAMGASPRSTPSAATPRSTPHSVTPAVSLEQVEGLHKKLRKTKKKLRQIAELSNRAAQRGAAGEARVDAHG